MGLVVIGWNRDALRFTKPNRFEQVTMESMMRVAGVRKEETSSAVTSVTTPSAKDVLNATSADRNSTPSLVLVITIIVVYIIRCRYYC